MHFGDWVGVAGLAVSVVGFGAAIWQLIRTANAAKATKNAVERAETRMAKNHLMVLLPQFQIIENDLDAAAQNDDPGLARRALVAYAHFATEVAAILQSQEGVYHTFVADLRISATLASQAKAVLIDAPKGKSTRQVTKEARERISSLSVHIGTLVINYQMSVEG